MSTYEKNGYPIEEGKTYLARAQEKLHLDSPDASRRNTQGNLVLDGDYVVCYIENDKLDSRVLIVFFDENGRVKRVSPPLDLNHSNNITFIPKRNAFLVSHCQADGADRWSRYSLVDRDTLTVTESGDLDRPFFAMAYSPELDCFASAEWAGGTIDYRDGDLNLLRSYEVETPKSLSQGCFCDERYVWFVRSSQNGVGPEIRLYDWYGELKSVIPIMGMAVEPESITVNGGEITVIANDAHLTGSIVFSLTLEETAG